HDGGGDGSAVREMPVQRRLADPGPAGDRGHADDGVLAGHHLAGGLDEGRPVALSVPATRGLGTVQHRYMLPAGNDNVTAYPFSVRIPTLPRMRRRTSIRICLLMILAMAFVLGAAPTSLAAAPTTGFSFVDVNSGGVVLKANVIAPTAP